MENFQGEYMTLECSDHELAEKIGKTVASVFSPKNCKNPLVIVGHDSSLSSGSIYDSVCRGICSAGVVAEKLGILPPAVVSHLAESHNANAGIMITAMPDGKSCGIRFYSEKGYKISHETGEEIKRLAFEASEELEKRMRTKKSGVIVCENALEEYVNFIKESVNHDLSGMKIKVKCSDQKNNDIVFRIFSEIGVEVTIITENKDFFAVKNGFDCGFIFENNGESCIAVDEKSNIIENDKLISVFAKFYRENNLLENNAFVVVNGISYGFVKFSEENNIKVVTAGYDENSIVTKMLKNNYSIGADGNGRFIFADKVHTSDGLFTAIKLLSIIKAKKSSLSMLADMKHYSQVEVDVEIPLNFREIWKNDRIITENIAHYIHMLGNRGKIFVHENSVNPTISIKAEGMDYIDINDAVQDIAQKIKERYLERSLNFENSK